MKVIVFDLDETILYTNLSSYLFDEKNPPIQFEELPHYFLPIADLIHELHNLGHRIAFFSAGTEERNVYVLKEWFDRNNLNHIPYEVFSRQHLSYNKFSDYDKKDLLQVLKPGENIEDMILVDDRWTIWVKGQGKHIHAFPIDAQAIKFLHPKAVPHYLNAHVSHIEHSIEALLGG